MILEFRLRVKVNQILFLTMVSKVKIHIRTISKITAVHKIMYVYYMHVLLTKWSFLALWTCTIKVKRQLCLDQ